MYTVTQLTQQSFPSTLLEIPDPPGKLYIRGVLPPPSNKMLCVVGARHYTSYGKEACQKLIQGLRGYPITIVSGLALGIDGIAHRAALDAGLQTCAIPGSGIDDSVLYPVQNRTLATEILDSGGCIMSEFDPYHKARPENFPQRNRIMAGLSHAVLIIEARLPSGTLITSRLASDYNRDVLAVPGSIFSKTSEGTTMLLKLGATPIRTSNDIIEALGFALQKPDLPDEIKYKDCSPEELLLINALITPLPKSALAAVLNLPIHKIHILVSMLELRNLLEEKEGLLYLI